MATSQIQTKHSNAKETNSKQNNEILEDNIWGAWNPIQIHYKYVIFNPKPLFKMDLQCD